MSDNVPRGFARKALDHEDHPANDHDHSQTGTTELVGEVPDSQPESQGLFIPQRYFPKVIPDSQPTQDYALEDSSNDGLEYDHDYSTKNPNERNSFKHHLTEATNDTPDEGLHCPSYDRNLSCSNSDSGAPHIGGREIPDSQESIENDKLDSKASNGSKHPINTWLQDTPNFRLDEDLKKEDNTGEAKSFSTESTDVIAGGTNLTRHRVPEVDFPDTAYVSLFPCIP